MDRKKSIIRGGAVLVVALAAGHLVQSMNADRAIQTQPKPKAIEQVSTGADPSPPVTAPATGPATGPVTSAVSPAQPADNTAAMPLPADLPEMPAPAAKPALAPGSILAALPDMVPSLSDLPLPKVPVLQPEADTAAPGQSAALEELPTPPLPAAAAPALPVAAKDCPVDLTLSAAPQAMISVRLSAPCRAGERVVLRHAGLALAESIPESGTLELDLPALAADGELSALFADAEVAQASVPIPDAGTVQRFAVQWMAEDDFQLHVLEGEADYGQPGHVWADAPVSPKGGYLVALGNPALDLPMMAQVYTWPADASVQADVRIEAAVTEATCGRELLGETLSVQSGIATVKDLTLAMPDCDAVGDILVLKNPGQDVTLAATN